MPSDSGDKEKKSSGTLVLLWERFLDSLVDRFSVARNEKRNRFILLFLTSLLLTFLIVPSQQFMAVTFKAGDIATSDIRATQDYLLEDRPLTQKKRIEAEAAAPYVYNLDTSEAQDVARSFGKALALVREARNSGETVDKGRLTNDLREALGVDVAKTEVAALLRVKSDTALLAEISRLAGRVYARKIVADRRRFTSDSSHGILVVNSQTGEAVGAADYLVSVIEPAEARKLLAGMKLADGGNPDDLAIIKGLLAKMLHPNLVFNREASEEKKRAAGSAVRPVLFQMKRGEMIVRVGERVSEEQALKLQKIFEARRGINKVFMGIGIFGLLLVLFYFPYRFARKNIRKFQPSNKDIFLLALVTFYIFLILKIGLIVSTAMGGLLPYVNTADYYYLFPFAVGTMLVRIILNSEVALVYCAICAPLLGIMFDSNIFMVIYALMGGIVGAHGVRQCKDRGTIYTAGLKVSVVNFAMAISFQIFTDSLFSMQTIFCALFALAGGLINAAFVTGTIPLIENLLHYTTDIKLLELANLNSPILRELMVRAPGTYHHSVLVGNLVEAAAEAINANPLLARVAAYYHDVGKVSKPLYFIENVGSGENKHDKLSPNMSALVLISHVKEGAELAKEHRLGLPIIDIIRQSHGTALISYFYQKAKNTAAHDVQNVDERDFRYPGPKPQTREAGLVLLADCVEAASRTLTDPTPARIQGLVQKIINNIFIDGQLDECELTLKNLHEIAKSFNRILAGIYHQRIDYPEPAYKEKEKGMGGKKPVEDSASEQAKGPADRDEEVKKGSGEDLKRLGIQR